jgi:hypothetical protein
VEVEALDHQLATVFQVVQEAVLLITVRLVQATLHPHLHLKVITAVLVAGLLLLMAVAVAAVHLLSVAMAHLLLQEMVVQVQPHPFQALASHTLAAEVVVLMVERLALAGQAAVEQVQHLIQLQPQVQPI